jgi:hypothetical protein
VQQIYIYKPNQHAPGLHHQIIQMADHQNALLFWNHSNIDHRAHTVWRWSAAQHLPPAVHARYGGEHAALLAAHANTACTQPFTGCACTVTA